MLYGAVALCTRDERIFYALGLGERSRWWRYPDRPCCFECKKVSYVFVVPRKLLEVVQGGEGSTCAIESCSGLRGKRGGGMKAWS